MLTLLTLLTYLIYPSEKQIWSKAGPLKKRNKRKKQPSFRATELPIRATELPSFRVPGAERGSALVARNLEIPLCLLTYLLYLLYLLTYLPERNQ